MSTTFLIADIHLEPEIQEIHAHFFTFLRYATQQAEKLYILGDLFEAWVGDDDDNPIYQSVIQALATATQAGLSIAVQQGNRDFLLGNQFATQTGCTLLPEEYVTTLYGTPVLLMHGDSLCTQDVAYQTFRQQARNPLWQARLLAQPLAQRRLLAQQARTTSRAHTQNMAENIMDVTESEVLRVLTKQAVTILIHGHTHRPAHHFYQHEGQILERWVVGDWQNQALILRCTDTQNMDLIPVSGLTEQNKFLS